MTLNLIHLMENTWRRAWVPGDGGVEMILAHVPESELLTYDEALALAEERDEQAANEFEASVPADAVLSDDHSYIFPKRETHVKDD